MKKLFMSLLGLGAVACQPQATDHPAVGSGHQAPAAPATAPAAASRPAPADTLVAAGPALPAADAALLRQYDLSRLWRGDPQENGSLVMDGFFGASYERIGFFFSQVQRDPQQPTLYHVEGKNRFRKLVTAFSGTIRVTSCQPLDTRQLVAESSILDLEAGDKLYSATATFDFQEYPRNSTAGRFSGTAHLDFVPDKANKPQLIIDMADRVATPSQGAGLLYQGQWLGYTSHAAKPLLLTTNIFLMAPAELTNFAVGERDPTFNPKYAKLGWNTYWANDEWWADSPKPKMAL